MDKILDLLKTVAPTAATMLGGPLAGIATKFLCDKLGVQPGDEEALVAAVKGITPEQITQLKQMDVDLQKFLKQNEIDLEKIAAGDRADARQLLVQTKSVIPAVLSIGITFGYFAILVLMLKGELKIGDSQALLLMLGALGTSFGMVIQFWFGTSHSSANKDATIQAQAIKK